MYQITDPEIEKQLLEMWNNKMQNSGEDNIEISGNWFVFCELNDKLETGIFNKTDAENCVFKGTEQRVKKVPLHAPQVRFIRQSRAS